MKYIFFITLFFILACTSKDVKIPKDIIAKDKMIEIYKDVHISDALVTNQKIIDAKVTNQLKKSYLVDVLVKHNVSILEYEKSNSFYENNEALMLTMYNELMIKLSEEQALLKGDKKQEKEEDKKK